MAKIKVELRVDELLAVLDDAMRRQLSMSEFAAISTGEEHEIFVMASRRYGRIVKTVTDALYPEGTDKPLVTLEVH